MVIVVIEKIETLYTLFPFGEIKINISVILAASEWPAGRLRP